MARPRLAALAVAASLATACATTTRTSTTWTDPSYGGGYEAWARYGRVEAVRETVVRSQGNPAAGAVAGAVVGGVVGGALGAHAHHDRWGRSHHGGGGLGALLGAFGGAMVGAAASQGGPDERTYEVYVAYDDGGREVYAYGGWSPFRPGQPVVLTAEGLSAR